MCEIECPARRTARAAETFPDRKGRKGNGILKRAEPVGSALEGQLCIFK